MPMLKQHLRKIKEKKNNSPQKQVSSDLKHVEYEKTIDGDTPAASESPTNHNMLRSHT